MKMIENEMNVTVHLEIIKATQMRQNEMKFLKIQYAARRCFNAAENYN